MIVNSPTNTLAGTEHLLRAAASILLDAQSIAKDSGHPKLEPQIHALVIAVLDLAKDVKEHRITLKMALQQ